MNKAELSLDAQIEKVALRLAAERQSLQQNLTLVQNHTRILLHTHPVLLTGLTLTVVLLWNKWRRMRGRRMRRIPRPHPE